ncbi:MAG TPA: M14 family metallopeptidase [Ilumatobacter sp.]|nr:M14 family metallopeptidase [Ilumatobacter sp.]
MQTAGEYGFDRFLRYDELVEWLHLVAAEHPGLVSLETYGRSHEGRDLWLVTVTDAATGAHDTKPGHWTDASIHAVELTATVAACYLIHRLVTGYADGDATVCRALATRTFYVVPRVNPDGAEWVLADRPRFRRSSTRPWPGRGGARGDTRAWPGHAGREDIDGDGRILQMRVADPHGGWMPHPDDARLLVPIPADGAPDGTPTYRLLEEGLLTDFDGFTIPTPRPVEGLDLNRNYPAGWGTGVPGSGDHPLSEPEIDAIVRALAARPNVCGFNAFHTSGGVFLRPTMNLPDKKLDPFDVWAVKQLGERAVALTGYTVHNGYEDFTWTDEVLMSGCSDDFAFEHLGLIGWTTEFWDIIQQATGTKPSTHIWYTGPNDDEALAVLRWCDANHPGGYVDWYPFEHPTLGPVELGGWDDLSTWTNPPAHLLRAEVAPHADFAVYQALCSPKLELPHLAVTALGPDTWRVEAGIANTGWLATDVTRHARTRDLVHPLTAELAGDGLAVLDGTARRRLGQLEGRAALRFNGWHDGTPDRALVSWTVRAPAGTELTVTATHPRAGTVAATVVLD